MQYFLLLSIVVAVVVSCANGFVAHRINNVRAPRVKPIAENFFLDIAEDPAINTPKEIFGEAAYKEFIATYDPNALLLGGAPYDIIGRVRALKLLTATADSGLLEALEAKGLTLSQVEKILPVIDELGVLPLVVANKGLLLALAPLLIEPAPALLPLVVNVVKTPPSTFTTAGAALLALGGYEALDNLFLGAPLALLGAPLLVLGSILSGSLSLPVPTASSAPGISTTVNAPSVSSTSSRPLAAKKRVEAVATPSVKSAGAPKVTKSVSTPAAATKQASLNGKRKTIKIK